MVIRDYDLVDAELLADKSSVYRFMVWEPEFLCIVLGQSNQLERSVIVAHALEDNVPVYKRPSGGEAVVLSPKMLVISTLQRGLELKSPQHYFNRINEKIIRALSRLGVKDLGTRGVSDLCLGEQKILGSSIYRNKDLVFYHGVLNRAESPTIMEQYLEHPNREPEYRKGRKHRDFVTSLLEKGYEFSAAEIRPILLEELGK
jgi:lipoate-protein ligase A